MVKGSLSSSSWLLLSGLGAAFTMTTGCSSAVNDRTDQPLVKEPVVTASSAFVDSSFIAASGCGACRVLGKARLTLPETGVTATSAKLWDDVVLFDWLRGSSRCRAAIE